MRTNPEAPPSEEREPNPLDRLTAGGWLKGLLRLALGAAVVAVVLRLTGVDAWAVLSDRRILPYVAVGAVVHAAQRAARIKKWALMIERAPLQQHPWTYLLRIQMIGLLANLVVPVSEALKLWAVARRRSEVLVATESIAADTALHSLMIGVVGVGGVAASGAGSTTTWGAAGALSLVSLGLLVGLAYWPRPARPPLTLASVAVCGWAALETTCQLGVYALAVRAVGVPLEPAWVLALAPILYLSDLFMLTPAGLGAREALFAGVLGSLSESPTELGVAMALTISAMLMLTALGGGAVALALPRRPLAGPLGP